ncbi:MAG TPA: MFS transporter, partial [Candidatus Limnocylindrales bacterium]
MVERGEDLDRLCCPRARRRSRRAGCTHRDRTPTWARPYDRDASPVQPREQCARGDRDSREPGHARRFGGGFPPPAAARLGGDGRADVARPARLPDGLPVPLRVHRGAWGHGDPAGSREQPRDGGAGLAGPFIGWLIDRHGPRTFYLVGIGFLVVAYLTYALANSWPVTILAMMAYWLGYSISGHSCATICGNCLVNRDRATAMMICETVGAGMLGIIGPIIGALIVSSSGTIDPGAIRPLFL